MLQNDSNRLALFGFIVAVLAIAALVLMNEPARSENRTLPRLAGQAERDRPATRPDSPSDLPAEPDVEGRSPATRPATQPTTLPDSPRPDGLVPPGRRDSLARRVAIAHHENLWPRDKVLRTEFALEFDGLGEMAGTMFYDLHRDLVRMELTAPEECTLVWDGEKAWVAPSEAELPRARFHLRTWSYFLAAPFKLNDPGTSLEEQEVRRMLDRGWETARLTFQPEVGDAPDDWYLLYVDPVRYTLKAMAYIVTYGKSTDAQLADAEADPHAIVYEDYALIHGLLISPSWTFYNWSDDRNIHGDPIGTVELSGLNFVEPRDGLFAQPADAREDPRP